MLKAGSLFQAHQLQTVKVAFDPREREPRCLEMTLVPRKPVDKIMEVLNFLLRTVTSKLVEIISENKELQAHFLEKKEKVAFKAHGF